MIRPIEDIIGTASSVMITGHVRPDGDCVGSTLALYTYLKLNCPALDVDVMLEQPTDKLAFVCNFDKICTGFNTGKTYDLVFCLDSASLDRIGKAEKYFRKAVHTVNIDHHVSNPSFADENYVFGDSSSCCEVLYGFLDPEKLNRDIAIALYTGMIYDTGVFKYPATSPQTMRIAAALMEYDIPTNYIIDESFYAKTYEENRIFGYAVLNSRLCFDGRVIYSSISREELIKFGVSSRELEGIVAQLRLTKGVWCAVFLHETNPCRYKASFRSGEEMDVNALASRFGGGGHIRASGANLEGTLDECVEKIMKEIADIFGTQWTE